MNVPFTLADAELDKAFLTALRPRMFNLKGHRSVGGMRATSPRYPWPVESLVVASEFENEHG